MPFLLFSWGYTTFVSLVFFLLLTPFFSLLHFYKWINIAWVGNFTLTVSITTCELVAHGSNISGPHSYKLQRSHFSLTARHLHVGVSPGPQFNQNEHYMALYDIILTNVFASVENIYERIHKSPILMVVSRAGNTTARGEVWRKTTFSLCAFLNHLDFI